MSQTIVEKVVSPCIGICELDRDSMCIGCGRTADEIGLWSMCNESIRRAIVEAAAKRLVNNSESPAARQK